MKTAALVTCGNSKRDKRDVSWRLYKSDQFKKFWAAGSAIGVPFIMSAEHGLVGPDERLDPYDESLNKKSKEYRYHWAVDVVTDLNQRFECIVLFGGRKYVEPMKEAISEYRADVVVYDPFQYASGNGQQQAIAGDIVRARRLGGTVEQSIEAATKQYRTDEP